jgi:hypothetical protein
MGSRMRKINHCKLLSCDQNFKFCIYIYVTVSRKILVWKVVTFEKDIEQKKLIRLFGKFYYIWLGEKRAAKGRVYTS